MRQNDWAVVVAANRDVEAVSRSFVMETLGAEILRPLDPPPTVAGFETPQPNESSANDPLGT